jgi:hypothetical protein
MKIISLPLSSTSIYVPCLGFIDLDYERDDTIRMLRATTLNTLEDQERHDQGLEYPLKQ